MLDAPVLSFPAGLGFVRFDVGADDMRAPVFMAYNRSAIGKHCLPWGRISRQPMLRPFSPFGDVDLASKSYEIQPAMARLIERGPAAQYVAQRSLLVSKCTPGAKDADHTVIPVAALAGCRGPGGTGK